MYTCLQKIIPSKFARPPWNIAWVKKYHPALINSPYCCNTRNRSVQVIFLARHEQICTYKVASLVLIFQHFSISLIILYSRKNLTFWNCLTKIWVYCQIMFSTGQARQASSLIRLILFKTVKPRIKTSKPRETTRTESDNMSKSTIYVSSSNSIIRADRLSPNQTCLSALFNYY